MPENINRNEVQTLVKNGAQVVEILGPKEYAWAHLPQAINIPLWHLKPDRTAELKRDASLIVYCNDYQ
jgi:rhodanese-related sulfurtransferase